MNKVLSRSLALALALVMLVPLLPFLGKVESKAAVNHTQEEAVAWIRARADESWWQDVDGAYGCQCVDLAMAYYQYLVGYRVSGNGCDYWTNSLPSGWYRDSTPTPGCIVSWKANSYCGDNWYTGQYGHVGLVYAVSGSTVYTVETNLTSGHSGEYGYSYAKYRERHPQNVIYIHPDFPLPDPISYTDVSLSNYYIKNVGTGLYLDVADAGTANATNVQVTNFNGSNAQTMRIICTDAGSKIYKIQPGNAGTSVINVNTDGVPNSGMNVNLWQLTGDLSQRWKFEKVDGGYIIRSAKNTSVVLREWDGNVRVQSYVKSGSDYKYQLWQLENHVYYDANGGKDAPATQYKLAGETLTLSGKAPVRDNYSFTGWNTKADGTGTAYASGAEFTAEASVKLYAQWKAQTQSGVNARPATCTEDGYTGDVVDLATNKILEYGKVIPALGHDGKVYSASANCSGGEITYLCSRCGKTYSEKGAKVTSAWTEKEPTGVDRSLIESKTQYRYKKQTTSAEWKKTGSGTYYWFNRPSGMASDSFTGYHTGALSASSTATTKREVSASAHNSYIYWHWVSSYCKGVGTNCFIGSYYGEWINNNYGKVTIWEALESPTDVRSKTNSDGTVVVTGHSDYSYNWFILETYRQTYTDYTLTSTSAWSDWSKWQDTPVVATKDVQVESRTLYRVNAAATGEHRWDNGVVTQEPTENAEGVKTYTCSLCGKTRTESIPKPEPAPAPVVAPDDAQIVVESKTVTRGNEFVVTVSVKNNPGVMCLALTPAYSDQLTLVKVEGADLLPEITVGKKILLNAEEDATEDGILLTLTFTTSETVAPGNYDVSFILWDSSDSEENGVDFAIVPGVITVREIAFGDANGDNEINAKDIVRLKNYIANYDDETGLSGVTVTDGADANGDGKINSKDIVRLKNYIANYDDEAGTSTVKLGA